MKRVIALLLVCFLLLGMLPIFAFAAEESANVTEAAATEETVSQEQITAWETRKSTLDSLEPGDLTEEAAAQIQALVTIPSLKARYTSMDEIEPNDTTALADRVYNDYTPVATVSGYDLDYFKFVLSETSDVVIGAAATRESLGLAVLDSSEEMLFVCLPLGYDGSFYTYGAVETLPAGTYYVCGLSMDMLELTYAFNITWEPHVHTHYETDSMEATCITDGFTVMTCACGDYYYTDFVYATGHAYDDNYDPVCNNCGSLRATQVPADRSPVDMYRMYNPNSGEHFYTGSTLERDTLVAAGWHYEGVGFTFPMKTGRPVYRLYDKYETCEHLYTMDEAEKNTLMAEGWVLEGIAFNSAYETEVPQYRLHNPNAVIGAYHFTASQTELNTLVAAGWEYQGIGFYTCGNKNVA